MGNLIKYKVLLKNGMEVEVVARGRTHAFGEAFRTLKVCNYEWLPNTVIEFRELCVCQCVKANTKRGRKPDLCGDVAKTILEMYNNGIGIEEIVNQLNVTYAGVYNLLDKLKIKEKKENYKPSIWDIHMQDLSARDAWIKTFISKVVKEGKIGAKKILYYDDRKVVLDGGNYRMSHQWSDYYERVII